MKSKREKAISKAKNNLIILRQYFKFGIPSIVELTRSGNTSLITINSDKPAGTGIQTDPMLKALKLDEKTTTFINDQIGYISMLPEVNRKILIYRYLKDKAIYNLLNYVEYEYYNKNQLYDLLKESIEMIAVYDPSIDYSISDFIGFRKKKLKKAIYYLLEAYQIQLNNGLHSENELLIRLKEILNVLSSRTKNNLFALKVTNTSQERKEYRYSVLTLAFYLKLFEYEEEEYFNDCERLGKNFLSRAKKEKSAFTFPHDR